MSGWNGKWHPLAERFPMLDEDEIREMAKSIRERGQYVACRMDANGLGLDGRNRVAACAVAEIEPLWEVYDGDPVTFIVEVNADRRHLTTGQRAMAIAIGLVESGQRENGRFKRGSVPGDNRRSSVSPDSFRKYVQEAGVVLDHAPQVADEVLQGDTALDAAYKQADSIRKREEQIAELGDENAKLVETGVITLEEAERRVEEDRRLSELPEDLVERIRGGGLALDEAEAIAVERAERIKVLVERIREAMSLLAPMAGAPVPPEISQALEDDERKTLTALLKGVPRV